MADQRAGRKLKQKSARDIRKKGGAPRKLFMAPWSSPTSLSGVEHAPQSSGPTLMQNLISQLQGYSIRRNIDTGAAGTSQLGPCFECCEVGHYKKSCPLLIELAILWTAISLVGLVLSLYTNYN